MAKKNRELNDLAESQFDTPEGLLFVRYGRRGAVSYKVSKHPDTDAHLIETLLSEGHIEGKWVASWDKARSALRSMSTKFKAVAE